MYQKPDTSASKETNQSKELTDESRSSVEELLEESQSSIEEYHSISQSSKQKENERNSSKRYKLFNFTQLTTERHVLLNKDLARCIIGLNP